MDKETKKRILQFEKGERKMMRKCLACNSIFNAKENSTTCLDCGSKRTIENAKKGD